MRDGARPKTQNLCFEKYIEKWVFRQVEPATDGTWVITECQNKEGFFLEITEVLSEVLSELCTNF